jgi:cystathionine beta-lyase
MRVRPETEWIHYEAAPGDPFSPSATPIYQTATFALEDQTDFDYSRSGNPTRRVLESQLARVEGGAKASAFASGMAAIDAVASLVGTGEEIVASADLYGGTYRLLTEILPRRGVSVRFAGEGFDAALERAPALVFIETPTNPMQRVTDLFRLAESCRRAGALLAVDNSLMSPCLQNPLDCGADLVVHSATKYLSGHADLTAGVVVARDEDLARRIAFHQNAAGSGLSPFEAFLLSRGMKTLPLRIQHQQRTAGWIAKRLQSHPAVRSIHYTGLDHHPGREIHFEQARGAGGVIAIETGSLERSKAFVEKLLLFSRTVSFGSIASTVSLPSRMSHASIPEEVRRERAFPEDLVRLSIGLEHPDDLIEDVVQALDRSTAK